MLVPDYLLYFGYDLVHRFANDPNSFFIIIIQSSDRQHFNMALNYD